MKRTQRPTETGMTVENLGSDLPEIQRLVDDLDGMLTRLRLGAIREQLDGLLEEAARRELNLREALAWLCAAEVASKEQRRLSMAMSLAHFPFVRTLEGFEFEAQPSIDPARIRELATCRWVANGDNMVLLGPPGGTPPIPGVRPPGMGGDPGCGQDPPGGGAGPGSGEPGLHRAVHHGDGAARCLGESAAAGNAGDPAVALRQAQAVDH
jgi:hypothetical protein